MIFGLFGRRSYSEQLRRRIERQGSRYVRLATGSAIPILDDLPALEVQHPTDSALERLTVLGYRPFFIADGYLREGIGSREAVYFLTQRNAAHRLDFDLY